MQQNTKSLSKKKHAQIQTSKQCPQVLRKQNLKNNKYNKSDNEKENINLNIKTKAARNMKNFCQDNKRLLSQEHQIMNDFLSSSLFGPFENERKRRKQAKQERNSKLLLSPIEPHKTNTNSHPWSIIARPIPGNSSLAAAADTLSVMARTGIG